MSSLNDEIKLFKNLWGGGYYEGDPLDPVSTSSYNNLNMGLGYISTLHAIYQACIRPFVNADTVVLEIGPGRGCWTRTMLLAREIWCLDALSADYNCFWDYIDHEHKGKIKYHEVTDFSCSVLPENHFDYLFSFGTFCHITWEGQKEYFKNLFPKLKRGANALVMIADFDKYNNAVRNIRKLRVRPLPGNPVLSSIIEMLRYIRCYVRTKWAVPLLDKNDLKFIPGKFYHAGIDRTCRYLEYIGWEVINPDVGLNHRDPIIHFRKP